MQDKSAFLGEDRLFPLLMRMSVPAIVGMLVMALYNVVDTIFVGRGASSLAIAGLTIAFPLQMIVGAVGQMIGVGAASIISRRLGEKRMGDAEAALGTAFASIAVISLVLAAVVGIFSREILVLFGATDEVMPYALEYVNTVVWGFPFLALGMSGNNMIRAEGNARMAMNTMLLGMGLNIILDPVFIFGLGMGIRGAALATVVSQACSFAWILLYYLKGKSAVALRGGHLRICNARLGEMTVLGLPNFVQMAGLSIITTIINNMLGTQGGAIAISSYGIANRLLSFIFMPITGLAQGFQPIAGYNYGARRFDRVKKVLLLASLSATVIALFCYAFIMAFPEMLVSMFTTDTALIAFGTPALRTMSLVIPIIGFQIVSSIYFQAVGKGMPALLLGLSRQFIVLLPIVLIFSHVYGINGVWASFPAADLLSTVITMAALGFEMRHLNTKHRETLEPAGAKGPG